MASPAKPPTTASPAHSPLVKTVLVGGDPDWGRILSAAGDSFPPERVAVRLDLASGPGRAALRTCNLTRLYIDLTASWRLWRFSLLSTGPFRYIGDSQRSRADDENRVSRRACDTRTACIFSKQTGLTARERLTAEVSLGSSSPP